MILSQGRHRHAARQQAIEHGAQIGLGGERQVSPHRAKGEQSLLPGEGQQRGGGTDQDLAAGINMKIRQQIPIEPSSQQSPRAEHPSSATWV